MNSSSKSIQLTKITKEMFKRWWLLLFSLILFAAASYFATIYLLTPIYRTSSTIFIGREGTAENAPNLADITLGQRLAIDYRQLIMTGLVLGEVIERLPAEYQNVPIGRNLSVDVITDSRFMFISFEDQNPERAVLFLNTLSQVLQEKSKEIFGVTNMRIVDYAHVPISPVRPSIINNTLAGGFLGLLFAALLILLKLTYNNPIQYQEDIDSETGLAVLGSTPVLKNIKINSMQWSIESSLETNPFAMECYRMAVANFTYMNIDNKIKTILFTSSWPEEGKTVSVSNIAYVLASSGKKVLLIDCDLRKGQVHTLFKLNRTPGLTNCLAQEIDCDNTIKSYKPCQTLHILTTGILPPTPADIILSSAFKNYINSVKGQYDYVLIDAPPVLPFADVSFAATIADRIVLIAASGKTQNSDLIEAKLTLEKTSVQLMGVLLTKVKHSYERDFYAYIDKK